MKEAQEAVLRLSPFSKIERQFAKIRYHLIEKI